MAARGYSSDRRPIILALECPRFEQRSGSTHQRSQPRQRKVPNVHLAAVDNIFSPCILTVHSGEDIGEAIRSFFEENNDNISSRYEGVSVEGCILSVSGDVSNPTINVQRSMSTIFEGIYSVSTLTGRYIVSLDGPVQQDYLKLSFQSGDRVVGGSVVGPLIAGCAVQVTVGYMKLNDGTTATIC